jgi:hypothetical protein
MLCLQPRAARKKKWPGRSQDVVVVSQCHQQCRRCGRRSCHKVVRRKLSGIVQKVAGAVLTVVIV